MRVFYIIVNNAALEVCFKTKAYGMLDLFSHIVLIVDYTYWTMDIHGRNKRH